MTDARQQCACGQYRDPLLDIEIQPTNGFESHVFVALLPDTPRGASHPRVRLWSCKTCAALYAEKP